MLRAQRFRVLGMPSCMFSRSYSRQPSKFEEEDFKKARSWLASFTGVPEHIYDVSYSRSSGPGGQNVNKVNSKATMKVDLNGLLAILPPVLHNGIRQTSYCADRSTSLVISCDESRKQADNRAGCETRLRDLIRDVGRSVVPGETSPETKKRVKQHQAAEKEARMRMKKFQSAKKSSRRKGSSDG
ncbi:MAG: hypothetical protein Q9162_003798 [Coniocarpon cinnabarinum]